MTRSLIALTLAALLALTVLPAAAQQQSGITLDARAGYDGAYRITEWFPVDVTLANDGPDQSGVLEWSVPGEPGETFRRQVDLPRGARKQVQFFAFSRSFAPAGRVRFTGNGQTLAEQAVRIEAIDFGRLVLGVVSPDPALLNALTSIDSSGGATVRHLELPTLPDNPAALRGLDALFLNDIDTATLRPAQREALGVWVRLGGTLVVGGGPQAQRTFAGIDPLLPAGLTGALRTAPLSGLSPEPQAPTATVSELQPRVGSVPQPSAAPHLLVTWQLGAGSVIQTGFDLSATRGWNGELELWGRLVQPAALFAPGTIARQQRSSLIATALELPSLALPSTTTILLLILGYVLAIGPLNYVLLRRFGRLELAWLTTPLLVVLFTVGFYVVGFGLRGGGVRLSQATVVEGWEGQPQGFATASASIFSPLRDNYTVSLPPAGLLSETRSDFEQVARPVLTTDTAVQIEDFLVDVASVQTFVAEQVVPLPIAVQSAIQQGVTGTVTNTGGQPLLDAIVVSGDRFWQLGTLAPGATFQLPGGAGDRFPDNYRPAQNGVIRRSRVVDALFDNNNSLRTRRAGQVDTGVYLLAWVDQGAVPITLSRPPVDLDAATLYVIRLGR